MFPRRKPSIPVRRTALALLLVASMALITVSYRGGAVLHGAQLVVFEAVSPIERGLSRAWDPIAGAWDWTGRVFTAAGDNPELRRENQELRAKLRYAEVDQETLDRYRRDLNFDETFALPTGYDRVWSQVTVRQPGAVESSLGIDRGSNDGLGIDDPVLVPGGLIGRVTAVTPNTAVISLIIDDSQRVSASVVGSEATGVLRTVSTEGVPTMQLKYVKQSAKVEQNDTVVTSGFALQSAEVLRSIYPKGIPVGVVTSVGNNPADLHKTVQVQPLADFDRIDEVMVLVHRGGGAE
jgi:rod shape-determining protein MreC